MMIKEEVVVMIRTEFLKLTLHIAYTFQDELKLMPLSAFFIRVSVVLFFKLCGFAYFINQMNR